MLYLYRAYDPNLQRFINRDPIEERGGINLYLFAVNAPINYIDLFGLLMADRWEEVEDRLKCDHPDWVFWATPGGGFASAEKGMEPSFLGDLLMGGLANAFRGPGALKICPTKIPLRKLAEKTAADLEAALEKRHIAQNAVRAAEEALAERMPALQQAQTEMVETALQHGIPSAQLGRAAAAVRKIEAELSPYQDALTAARINLQKANEAVKKNLAGGD